jgi:hypothetical protein
MRAKLFMAILAGLLIANKAIAYGQWPTEWDTVNNSATIRVGATTVYILDGTIHLDALPEYLKNFHNTDSLLEIVIQNCSVYFSEQYNECSYTLYISGSSLYLNGYVKFQRNVQLKGDSIEVLEGEPTAIFNSGVSIVDCYFKGNLKIALNDFSNVENNRFKKVAFYNYYDYYTSKEKTIPEMNSPTQGEKSGSAPMTTGDMNGRKGMTGGDMNGGKAMTGGDMNGNILLFGPKENKRSGSLRLFQNNQANEFVLIGQDRQFALLDLANQSLENVKLDFSTFDLETENIPYEKICWIFQHILEYQKKEGYSLGVKKAEIDFKRYKNLQDGYYGWIIDKLQTVWWNYGYDKKNIISGIILLILLFSGINLTFFNRLISEIYTLGNFNEGLERIKKCEWFIYFPGMFIMTVMYTSIIFFGLKLDLDKLNFRHLRGTIYIFSVYSVGLICTAFLINYIVH